MIHIFETIFMGFSLCMCQMLVLAGFSLVKTGLLLSQVMPVAFLVVWLCVRDRTLQEGNVAWNALHCTSFRKLLLQVLQSSQMKVTSESVCVLGLQEDRRALKRSGK